MTEFTYDSVKAWLLEYAWLGSPTERAAEVDCIMAQNDWEVVDAIVERYMGQWSGEGDHSEALKEATEFALSGLYETHDEPHLTSCPRHPHNRLSDHDT